MRFVVRSCKVEYLKSARLDDDLEVHTKIICNRGASLLANQVVQNDQGPTTFLDSRIACVGEFGRPVPWPLEVRSALTTYLQVSQGSC